MGADSSNYGILTKYRCTTEPCTIPDPSRTNYTPFFGIVGIICLNPSGNADTSSVKLDCSPPGAKRKPLFGGAKRA
jgi:hypothetical protein